MPVSCKSAPYCARPVTLSTPSWRMGRVPMTLYLLLLLFFLSAVDILHSPFVRLGLNLLTASR